MHPDVIHTKEGSPFTKPCPNSEMTGTADEPSVATQITTPDDAGAYVSVGPVPLFLVLQTLSAEIRAYRGDISSITIRRTGQHVYAITLARAVPKGMDTGKKTGCADSGADGVVDSSASGCADSDAKSSITGGAEGGANAD